MIAALVADGWTITDDPLTVRVGDRDLQIDLGAERPVIGAVKGNEKIAVEVQSFRRQYAMYRVVLAEQQPDRPIFLAVSNTVYDGILSEPLGQLVLTSMNVRVLVFDPARQEVVRWIS